MKFHSKTVLQLSPEAEVDRGDFPKNPPEKHKIAPQHSIPNWFDAFSKSATVEIFSSKLGSITYFHISLGSYKDFDYSEQAVWKHFMVAVVFELATVL